MTEPVLTRLDRDSATWKKVRAHLEAKLATLRAENDRDMEERKTAVLRGRIKEVKALLALDSDAPPVQDDSMFHE